MNFNSSGHRSSPAHKENIPLSSKPDGIQRYRTKQRTVLGVLSDNEQRGRPLSQGSHISKCSSISDNSQLNFLSLPSSSGYDLYVEEACEVVLAASGEELVSDRDDLDAEAHALQNEHMRLLLELSSSSHQDSSMHSEADESLLWTPTLCVDYADDIHQNLRESEKRFRAKQGYIERHPEITTGMRPILVDWLVEVAQDYQLTSETLHLAVNYMDRFLSCTTDVRRGKLQLVGTAALMIAAKYEEIFVPKLNEFVYITDSTYTRKQLVQMETTLLRVLSFNMSAPTIYQFLRLFISIHSVCPKTENLALYIAEQSLMEMDPVLQYNPSIVAAGCYCLATYTINQSLWPHSLIAFTGYTMGEIMPCLSNLHELYINAESCPHKAIRNKYRNSK
ncbi:cyclin-A1-like [Cololabis saira]|uniref:cyclin-A1-like n=1 Tax=Cololabis saira TaxID=129043 RepID=UPI002AD497C3|nr:cyclin-A1-like [Cololabis saira]